MEGGQSLGEKVGTKEVVVVISSAEEAFEVNKESKDSKGRATTEAGSYSFSKNSQLEFSKKQYKDSSFESTELENLQSRAQMSTFSTSPSPERSKLSPSLIKPPKVPSESVTRRRSIMMSVYSKPKSRLVEPFYPANVNMVEANTQLSPSNSNSPYRNSPNKASPINKVTTITPKGSLKSTPITPKTPLISSPGGEVEDDEAVLQVSEKSGKRWRFSVVIEWVAFVCIMMCLVASLTIHRLQHAVLWGLEMWKWCVLVLVIFCGRLFSEWFINVIVFSIERNFLLKKKVLYFVFGLKNSVQVCIWLGLVLLAWGLLLNLGVKRSKKTTKVLNYVTRALASCLIGAVMWMVKTLLVKLLASSFHVTRFFDRIQESIFHQYVLQTLSGPPLMEMAENVGSSKSSGHLSFKKQKKGNKGEKEEVIDVEKLHKMKQEKVSAWTMKSLIKVIRSSGLSTLSDTLEESADDEGGEQKDEITNEVEAKAAADKIFRKVAKPGSNCIDEEDLWRFMNQEEVDNVLSMFEGAAETRKIKESSLQKWVVNVYLERKSLAHSLNDTKTAIEELNKLTSGIVLVVIIIVWLLLMGFATTQVLVFISSQILLVVFMFGNTCKTVFEAIIFVFVMHPFDVGDRCVIDGVQMVVEEMNILTTIFLRYDNEKIFYPNSVLITKPISNFYRSPEMSDSVEFAVDVSTSIKTIGALKARVKGYLESKPQHWRPSHSVLVKEIEDVNKMKMGLNVTHTINFQNYGEKSSRRSELVMELKNIFEDLGIKYNLLPQEVLLSNVGPAASVLPTNAR